MSSINSSQPIKLATLNTGATLSVEPLFSKNDILLNKFQLVERLGGDLPEIVLEVRTTEDCCQLNDILKFKIVNETGWCNEFDAYVYELSYLNTNLTLKLTACNPEFVRDIHTVTYKGVREVLNGTWKYDIDSNADPDLIDTLDMYQQNKSNYKYLLDVMYGYRKDTIWGFAAGKLVIRDLINWSEEYKIDRQEDIMITDPQAISDPIKNSREIEELEKFTYFTKIRFGDDIIDVDNRYLDLLENRAHNSKFSNYKSAYKFNTRYIPPITIGSNVTLFSNETDVKQCFVTERIIKVQDSDFTCNFKLSSVNP